MANKIVPHERIENRIFLIWGKKVMLDRDLADLYGVKTSYLNRQVRRNIDRFPSDFMFQLTSKEYNNLICHFGTSNLKSQSVISSWGGVRKLPFAFTEHGILMLSSVLNSPRAVHVNIQIMRAFVRLRQILAGNKELAEKLKELENKVEGHDADIKAIFDAIKELMSPPPEKTKRIGFLR